MATPDRKFTLQDALFLANDLLCAIWCQFVVLDWLTSTVNPYPYVQSIITTLIGCASCVVDARLTRKIRRLLSNTFEISIISVLALCLELQCTLCLLAAIAGALGLWICFLARNRRRSKLTLAIVSVTFLYIISRFGISEVSGSNLEGSWLGTGLGTPSPQTGQIHTTILSEWGLPLFVVVLSMMFCALLTSACTIAQRGLESSTNVRTVTSAFGAGAIISLLLCSQSKPVFLTVDSVWGTAALALAILCIKVGAATGVSEQRKEATTFRSFENRRSSIVVAAIALMIFSITLGVHLSLQARVKRLGNLEVPVGYPSYTVLSRISQAMQDATIAMEDSNFYQHHGFDWIAIHRALRVDIREGRIEQGGSTISQQLAKNLFLTHDRTLERKAEEAAFTIELEHTLPKTRILELYLNTIDYGMGCHGITEAAKYYFATTPDKLTLAESAVLVGLVPNPPQPSSQQNNEPQYEDLNKIATGERVALGRINYFFPDRYSQQAISEAQNIPLERVIYPYKDAWDRGATVVIPAVFHGVGFYSFADPDEPSEIDNASSYLEPELVGFLDDARRNCGLTGIDHIGVYNDRGMRQEQSVLSAHAFGQAIDISGFRFADGSRIAVKDHRNPIVLARLIRIKTLLKRHFDIVVDWRDDPLRHQTHFHCEVRGPRPTTQREPLSVSAEVSIQIQNLSRSEPDIAKRFKPWIAGEQVAQTHPMSCGPASLATVFTYYIGRPTTESVVMRAIGTDGNTGVEMSDLRKACVALHTNAVEEQLTTGQLLEKLAESPFPIPVLVGSPEGHYIDIVGQVGNNLLISDPNHGNYPQPISDFAQEWSGEALIVTAPDRKLTTTLLKRSSK